MSINMMQRLAVPKKENYCSRNCLAKSLNESRMQMGDHSKCSQVNMSSKTINTHNLQNRNIMNNMRISTNNLNTSLKFIAPMALSKSTTYDRKFKSIFAQREAEYDKNLKSIKVNLFKNGNFAQRENMNISQGRMNKFKTNNSISTSTSLNINRKTMFRDRSRSITNKSMANDRANLMKSTPREDSILSEKTENTEGYTSEQANKYDNEEEQENKGMTGLDQNEENEVQNYFDEEKGEDFTEYMKKEEEVQIDLGLISDICNVNPNSYIEIGNSKITNEENILSDISTSKMLELHMKDQMIFNKPENLSLMKDSFYSLSRSSKMNILSQSQYSSSLTGSIPISHNSVISHDKNFQQSKLTTMPSLTNYNFIQDNINKINLGIFTCNYENLKTNKESCVKFTKEEYRKLLSTYLRFEYGKNILEELYQEEEINEQFLLQHEITERMRMRMIDWMIEVLCNYRCEDNTYFLAVNIMDRFFRLSKQILKPEELHLIGLCSMFISSKFYDVYPMKLKLMVEKVGHNKFSAEQIKIMEETIVKTLNYEILKPTSFEFLNYYFEEIFFHIENNFTITNDILSEYFKHLFTSCGIEVKLDFLYYEKFKNTKKFTTNMLNLLRHVVIYLAKMNCHDYNLISIKPSLLAASSIFVGVKICEQINNEEYINDYFTNKLCEISRQREYDLLYYAQKILYNAQNSDSLFTGLENLKRVHFNYISALKETNYYCVKSKQIKSEPKFIQVGVGMKNPDQVAGDSVGGDNGEFLRRNQPQEHIIIPLINSLEAQYNPMFAPDIRKYRKKEMKQDKGLKYKEKISRELNIQVAKLLKI